MPPKNFQDLTGRVFYRLTVLGRSGTNNNGSATWLCQCSCKDKTIITTPTTNKLNSGHTRSCGCLQREALIKRNYKHGYSIRNGVHPLYDIWSNIIERCYGINNPAYKDYGERGITVCDEWRNYPATFIEWALVNGWDKDLVIDKINNDGNYEPGNCRFITDLESHRNMSRCLYFTYNSETLPLSELVEKYSNHQYATVLYRVNKLKWTIEKAMFEPLITGKERIKKAHEAMRKNRSII